MRSEAPSRSQEKPTNRPRDSLELLKAPPHFPFGSSFRKGQGPACLSKSKDTIVHWPRLRGPPSPMFFVKACCKGKDGGEDRDKVVNSLKDKVLQGKIGIGIHVNDFPQLHQMLLRESLIMIFLRNLWVHIFRTVPYHFHFKNALNKQIGIPKKAFLEGQESPKKH